MIKKGDFVELHYTGKLKDENIIFDTTEEAVAKKENLYDPKTPYNPVIICVGEHHVIKGLDHELIGKNPGTYEIFIAPEDGFGKKNAKLLRLMPLNAFKKQQVMPQPGLQVNIDGSLGVVRTVHGGRVIVDFNHPLAGKDLVYTVVVIRIVDAAEEKIKGLLTVIGLGNAERTIENNKLTITLPTMIPLPLQDEIQGKIKALIPEIMTVEFMFPAKEEKKPKKKIEAEDAEKKGAEAAETEKEEQPKKQEATVEQETPAEKK